MYMYRYVRFQRLLWERSVRYNSWRTITWCVWSISVGARDPTTRVRTTSTHICTCYVWFKQLWVNTRIQICFADTKTFQIVYYLVFEYCEHDLAGLLSNKHIRLHLSDIKEMLKQLLNGLYYIHKNSVNISLFAYINQNQNQRPKCIV